MVGDKSGQVDGRAEEEPGTAESPSVLWTKRHAVRAYGRQSSGGVGGGPEGGQAGGERLGTSGAGSAGGPRWAAGPGTAPPARNADSPL